MFETKKKRHALVGAPYYARIRTYPRGKLTQVTGSSKQQPYIYMYGCCCANTSRTHLEPMLAPTNYPQRKSVNEGSSRITSSYVLKVYLQLVRIPHREPWIFYCYTG